MQWPRRPFSLPVGRHPLGGLTRTRAPDVVWLQLLAAVALISLLALTNRLHPFFPGPVAIGAAGMGLLGDAQFYVHVGVTLYEAFAGLALAILLGIGIGIAVGASQQATEFLNPIILGLYSIPKIIFLPVLLMFFGTGTEPKIANAAIHAVFPILLNCLVGMREINRIHLKVAKSLSASFGQIVWKIYLPSMVPPVVAGIRLGLGLAFLGALLAELFEARAGIGFIAMRYYTQAQIDNMFAVIIAMFLVILGWNALMKRLENRLSRWRHV